MKASAVTWGSWYWPLWAMMFVATLLVPEIYALLTNVNNTQSYWVWRELDVTVDGSRPWTAFHFLAFGAWIVTMVWLTAHFFYRRFT